MSQPSPVNILSDDDESEHLNDVVSTPFAIHSKRRRTEFDSNPTTVFVIDDDPTPPRKPSGSTSVPSFSAEVESDHKFSGNLGFLIFLMLLIMDKCYLYVVKLLLLGLVFYMGKMWCRLYSCLGCDKSSKQCNHVILIDEIGEMKKYHWWNWWNDKTGINVIN